MIYKEKMTFEEMIKKLGSKKLPRYAFVFPNTIEPLTEEQECDLASVVISLAEKIYSKK